MWFCASFLSTVFIAVSYMRTSCKKEKTAQPFAGCAEIYGLNYSIVYVKVRTFALTPFTKTAALIVVSFFTVMGAVYSEELAVGAFPFVV